MNSRATHDGTKDFFGRTGPSRRLISWLTDAAVFISAQPSRATAAWCVPREKWTVLFRSSVRPTRPVRSACARGTSDSPRGTWRASPLTACYVCSSEERGIITNEQPWRRVLDGEGTVALVKGETEAHWDACRPQRAGACATIRPSGDVPSDVWTPVVNERTERRQQGCWSAGLPTRGPLRRTRRNLYDAHARAPSIRYRCGLWVGSAGE